MLSRVYKVWSRLIARKSVIQGSSVILLVILWSLLLYSPFSEHQGNCFLVKILNGIVEEEAACKKIIQTSLRSQECPLSFLNWQAEEMEENDYFWRSWKADIQYTQLHQCCRICQESCRLFPRIRNVLLVSLNDKQKKWKRRSISTQVKRADFW